MADLLSSLDANDLLGFNQSVVQSDPLGISSNVLQSWQPDTSTWGATATGLTSFGKSFLSGVLGNMARNNAAEQLNKVVSVLPQLQSNPLSVAAPEGINADAFAALKGKAILQSMQNQALQAQEKKSRLQTIATNIFTEGVKNESMTPVQALAAAASDDPVAALAALGGTAPTDPLENPNSKAYKVNKDKIDIERSLANDFNARAADFKYKEQGLKALTEAYLDPAGTSDFEIIRRGAQAVEPGLAVRADDQASLRGAASALGMTYQAIQSAISGDTKLDDKVRAGIMRIAKRSYDASLQNYNTIRDSFLQRALEAKVNETSVVPFGAGKPFEELYPNLNIGIGLEEAGTPKLKASDLIVQGYTKGPTGWIPPATTTTYVSRTPRG